MLYLNNINNSLKKFNSGAIEFCTLLEVVKSIGVNIDSAATNLSWSFISSQKGRFKIINNYLFTHSHTVELDWKSKKTILPGTCTSKKVSTKKKTRISLPVTNNNSSSSQLSVRGFSLFIVDLIH